MKNSRSNKAMRHKTLLSTVNWYEVKVIVKKPIIDQTDNYND